MDRGSFATAMRATMSLPLVFPPVERDGRMLVDGGMMNNVPADVVRAMGARRVIAVNVGDLSDRVEINQSLFAVAGASLDAMMRANTKLTIRQADIIIDVPLAEFGSLDWRRSKRADRRGLQGGGGDARSPAAARGLAPTSTRSGRRRAPRAAAPRCRCPTFSRVEGFSSSDERQLNDAAGAPHRRRLQRRHVSRSTSRCSPASIATRRITWRFVKNAAGENGVLVQARPKPYGPPFLMLGLNLENTTSEDFRVTFTGRYLAFDVLGLRLGAAHRRHARLGSGPGVGLLPAVRRHAAVRRAVRRHRRIAPST